MAKPVSSEAMADNLVHPPRLGFEGADINGLLPLLQWLDTRLEQLMATQGRERTPPSILETGCADDSALNQLSTSGYTLAAETGSESSFSKDVALDLYELTLHQDSAIAWLRQQFSLSSMELGVVMIALAP
jgi:hypothetical protein